MQSKSTNKPRFNKVDRSPSETVNEPIFVVVSEIKDGLQDKPENKFPIAETKTNIIRILHVDDDSSFLEVSKRVLCLDNNFEIEGVLNVKDAFKKLSTGNYDVIVSDYEMPQKNGLQFLKELRDRKSTIPFLLFTGKDREEVAIGALNLGADGCYSKQGNPETVYRELSNGIKQAFDRKQFALEFKNKTDIFESIVKR